MEHLNHSFRYLNTRNRKKKNQLPQQASVEDFIFWHLKCLIRMDINNLGSISLCNSKVKARLISVQDLFFWCTIDLRLSFHTTISQIVNHIISTQHLIMLLDRCEFFLYLFLFLTYICSFLQILVIEIYNRCYISCQAKQTSPRSEREGVIY